MRGEVAALGADSIGELLYAAPRCVTRRSSLALLALSCIGFGVVPSAAAEKTIRQRIVGAWSFVTSINTRKDGSAFDRWGANPTGMLIFESTGHYSQMITSQDRIFGAKTVASFGQYTVDEETNTIVTKIAGSTTSRAVGATQQRFILSLTDDELRYVNPETTIGHKAEVVWKRLK